MAYSWNESAQAEGSAAQGERLPKGIHDVAIKKIVFGGRNGPFTSQDGSPQILLIFADSQDREVAQMVTLNHKAGWVLARILGSFDPPANLARMEADGVEPDWFIKEEFATKQLLDRKLRIQVAYKAGTNGKEYADIVPVKPQVNEPPTVAPAPAAAPAAPPAPVASAPPAVAPAATVAPAQYRDKDSAWKLCVETWASNPDLRNGSWVKCVQAQGKPEADFTADDWQAVADAIVDDASTPF
jgi:hypothetical protein